MRKQILENIASHLDKDTKNENAIIKEKQQEQEEEEQEQSQNDYFGNAYANDLEENDDSEEPIKKSTHIDEEIPKSSQSYNGSSQRIKIKKEFKDEHNGEGGDDNEKSQSIEVKTIPTKKKTKTIPAKRKIKLEDVVIKKEEDIDSKKNSSNGKKSDSKNIKPRMNKQIKEEPHGGDDDDEEIKGKPMKKVNNSQNKDEKSAKETNNVKTSGKKTLKQVTSQKEVTKKVGESNKRKIKEEEQGKKEGKGGKKEIVEKKAIIKKSPKETAKNEKISNNTTTAKRKRIMKREDDEEQDEEEKKKDNNRKRHQKNVKKEETESDDYDNTKEEIYTDEEIIGFPMGEYLDRVFKKKDVSDLLINNDGKTIPKKIVEKIKTGFNLNTKLPKKNIMEIMDQTSLGLLATISELLILDEKSNKNVAAMKKEEKLAHNAKIIDNFIDNRDLMRRKNIINKTCKKTHKNKK